MSTTSPCSPTLAFLATGALAALAACGDTSTNAPGLDGAAEGPTAHAPAAGLPAPAAAAHDLSALRRATAPYHLEAAALQDGFLADPVCVEAPPGGMGHHYVHPARMADLVIDPRLPEALLYEPLDNGRVRLMGAEFLVHGDEWDAVHENPPSFAGVEFDPPMDRNATTPPGPFYTLHVWVWKQNPSGMFAPFNPRVSCPS